MWGGHAAGGVVAAQASSGLYHAIGGPWCPKPGGHIITPTVRTVIALFDAPAPAEAARAALAALGVEERDLLWLPPPGPAAELDPDLAEENGPRRRAATDFEAAGVPRRDAAEYVRVNRQGFYVVGARCPNASVRLVADALNGLGALDPDEIEPPDSGTPSP